MENKKREKTLFILLLFVISFILNFIWEILHSPLYLHPSESLFSSMSFFNMILYASIIDSGIIVILYLFTFLIFRKFYLNKTRQFVLFGLASIFIALFIEIRALNTGRWVYNSSMPTIFGIGLSPLIQLAFTGIITIILLKKLRR